MPPSYFPLRWESTGDQWWYASPIDWAAANGLYDLVVELLHLDANLLIKLTSLRRIRRLETVWDDEAQFDDVAKCRSLVAKRLLHECESKKGANTLIRAGYGGWLLYTAASAGDMDFVRQLLDRDPFLVFGEGEYGVTDIFYAAARSKNAELFTMLLDFAVSSRDGEDELSETRSVFKWEMMNRAAHAAARGGTLEILRKILGDSDDVLAYRDVQGSTVLHTASGRGQVEVVKYLVESFEIITSTDNQGNTALHVAAYRGYLKVVEFLFQASPSLASAKNGYGNTFLHVAVAGFRTPAFRRIDRQIELMKQSVCGEVFDIRDIINVRNSDGRTALHMAVTENVQSSLVELLMSVPYIDLNVRDADGLTPLDLLKRRPKSASSEILIKELIAAGGISNCQDNVARSAIVSCLKEHGVGASPGTSFRVPDAEIFLYTGFENAYDAGCDQESVGYSSCLSELSDLNLSNSFDNKKSSSINHTARRLKNLLHWPRKKEIKASSTESVDDDDPLEVTSTCRNWQGSHIPLREKYTKSSSLPNNKRTFSLQIDLPSQSSRKKFTAGLTHGVIQAAPHLAAPLKSPPSPFSVSSTASPGSVDEQKGIHDARLKQLFNGKTTEMNPKQISVDKRLMNQYFCFGAQGLAVVEDNGSHTRLHRSLKSATSLVA
ncbi:hypothetical protein V6N13_017381 [Hibiscus sabdariffa]|uniref:Uncharacterized protein n=1 Tax=Hibiscus sabdariffa TaxID=183260 RepID=A0ABR2CZ58_9ROSI